MKRLISVILFTTLISCTNNMATPNNNIDDNSKYLKLKKDIEDKLGNQGIVGISTDSTGNLYIISSFGNILKVDKESNNVEYKENNKRNNFPTTSNTFFNIDKNGNGFFIPTTSVNATVDSINSFPIFKITNLSISNDLSIKVKNSIPPINCISPSDCSDLSINDKNGNYLLSSLVKSPKEYIENNFPIRNGVFNFLQNGFYYQNKDGKNSVYSLINGVSTDTGLSFGQEDEFHGNLDFVGNGYFVNPNREKKEYYQVDNYKIGKNITVDEETYKYLNSTAYVTMNNEGTGIIIASDTESHTVQKINNFKLDQNKEILVKLKETSTYNNFINIDKNGNGFICLNKYLGSSADFRTSNYQPIIFAVKNFKVIK